MTDGTTEISTSTAIDPENPWLGLSSYSEETRAYFHGRDDEAAELARRVQRKLLTVLFGQSGLGKTSLLRAGLVPRLRGEGFCPVYVRIVYAPDSPPPSEQIKQAIFKATADAGHWSRPGSAVEGESLWEFLHHRGDLLRDTSGRMLLPLLIFDQFEEIFTLAQADDAGRLRAKVFLEELADLVENRPPVALEQRIDRDEVDAGQYDFARADYRILIALREDYLAHLESVKAVMPSITQNRMRLARMTGVQALSAVMKPGGSLVSQEVAESIVRFVAGGSELANAEVEPSLLSLICRELNTVRQAQGRAEISADLLAGSRDTILSEFYERALADQPPGVRRVIEDELLTESGYRESLAEERVIKALAAAGAEPDALAKLVDRRLLRIEERLDLRRVELTHDVLCSVVGSSRNLRHEREARDEAERQLAAQQERAAETRRTLRKTRRFAMIAAGLMLVAVVSAIFSWISWNRAKAADAQAQKARADAEQLVGFLIEDFYSELQPTGRLETMGKLAHMAVKYYDGLPPKLVTPQTQIYRGMALIREAEAMLARGDYQQANPRIDEASALFAKLHDAGDKSEAVAVGMALAKFTRFSAWGVTGSPGSKREDLPETADLLRPLVAKPDASREVRMLYADVLNYLSHTLQGEAKIAACEESRKILVGLGAKDLTDLRAASIYADTSDSEARHSVDLGRIADAERLEKEVYDIAEQVLAQRPGDLRSMANRALAADLLGRLGVRRNDFPVAAEYGAKSEQAGENYVRFNPSDFNSWVYWIRGKDLVSEVLYERGDITDSIASLRATVALENDPRKPGSLGPILWQTWFGLANAEAQHGQREAADAALQKAAKAVSEAAAFEPEDTPRRKMYPLMVESRRARNLYMFGNGPAAREIATTTIARLHAINAGSERMGSITRDNVLRGLLVTQALTAIELGEYAEAEAATRERLALQPNPFNDLGPQVDSSRAQVLLAYTIAKQGRKAEALGIVEPEIERYRAAQKGGAGGTTFQVDLANALFVSAISRPDDAAGRARKTADLAAAEKALAGLTPQARQLFDARDVVRRIAAARAGD
jgi:tetratricopeptide (TPR) repeat protein